MNYIKVGKRTFSRVSVGNFKSGINTSTDQSVMPLNVAADCYNFDFTSGALKGTDGFTATTQSADSVWTANLNGEQYLMYCFKGEIYYKKGAEAPSKLSGIKLTGVPKAIGYRLYGEDVVLICSPTDNMVVWNGTDDAYYVNSSPLITSMALHYERMFVTTSDEPDTLWFSDDLDPTNWNTEMSEGGFIELADDRGKLIRAVEFLNYVYIFRERGISRLTAYANQSEFLVSHLFVTGGRIYPESIALCGDRVIFASSDGIFEFDGLNTRRILTNLDGALKPDESCVAAYHDGKYYLALKAQFTSDDGFATEYVNNALLVYGDSGYTLMRGYDITALHSGGSVLYAVIGGKINELKGKCELNKRWTVPFTDLGSGRVKLVHELYLDTKTDIVLTVKVDETTKSVVVKGKNTTSRINVNLKGRKVGIVIESSSPDPLISRPQLSYCYAAG